LDSMIGCLPSMPYIVLTLSTIQIFHQTQKLLRSRTAPRDTFQKISRTRLPRPHSGFRVSVVSEEEDGNICSHPSSSARRLCLAVEPITTGQPPLPGEAASTQSRKRELVTVIVRAKVALLSSVSTHRNTASVIGGFPCEEDALRMRRSTTEMKQEIRR